MKTTTIAAFAAVSLFSAAALGQTPPSAPAAPAAPGVPATPAVPAAPGDRGGKHPKVPVTYLGVETSELPSVVADQLGMAKGFGLVVDYVVPEGPAAAAGLQQNDILKMLNDQILMEPDQLSKLIRSFPEGTNVTLTVLRKGAETKLTARLGKREVPQRRGHEGHRHGPNMGQLGPEMEKLTEELGRMQFGGNDGAAATAMAFVDKDRIRDEVRRARREALRHAREAREVTREARENGREAAREARRAGRDFRFSYGEDGRLKTTHIDMNKAQIIYHDDKGELKIETVAGKKVLTAKDPQGRLVFSGPVGTPEELEKVPAEVRQRYDKLEQKDLPAVTPAITGQEQANEVHEEDEEDDDADEDEGATEVLQVLRPETTPFPHRRLGVNTILI